MLLSMDLLKYFFLYLDGGDLVFWVILIWSLFIGCIGFELVGDGFLLLLMMIVGNGVLGMCLY